MEGTESHTHSFERPMALNHLINIVAIIFCTCRFRIKAQDEAISLVHKIASDYLAFIALAAPGEASKVNTDNILEIISRGIR